MLVVAIVINRLTSKLKNETALAQINERRARQLQELAIALANTASASEVCKIGQEALNSAFAGPNIIALTNDSGALIITPDLSPMMIDGLRCCINENAILGAGTMRWPDLEAWYIPLGESDTVCGAVCINRVNGKNEMERDHARALCSLLAQVLWRLRLTVSMQAAQNEAQKQQLQAIFLSAISHDLRTPLAVVVGAASSLQTQRDKLSLNEQDQLLCTIIEEANYLTTVTENTLQLVRLSNAVDSIHRDWESMEEIIGAVLARVRRRDSGHRILSKVPENLPLLRLDPVLIAQLISNLLDNALKYSDDKIALSVEIRTNTENQQLQVFVQDRGPGIPENEHLSIFQPYSRLGKHDQSTQRSAGLGLAVCRAIALAHGGDLIVLNRTGGGCNFILSLPIDTDQPFAIQEKPEV
jgi:two-component system sensor histidine kinase KdpD